MIRMIGGDQVYDLQATKMEKTSIMGRILGFIELILHGIAMFFYVLFQPHATKYGTGYTRTYKPGSGPPRPPTKKFGGLNLKPSMNVGCSSCSGGN